MTERVQFVRTAGEHLRHHTPELMVVERADGNWVAMLVVAFGVDHTHEEALRELEHNVADKLQSQSDHDQAVMGQLRKWPVEKR